MTREKGPNEAIDDLALPEKRRGWYLFGIDQDPPAGVSFAEVPFGREPERDRAFRERTPSEGRLTGSGRHGDRASGIAVGTSLPERQTAAAALVNNAGTFQC